MISKATMAKSWEKKTGKKTCLHGIAVAQVWCTTRDQRAVGSSLTVSLHCGPRARHIYPSLKLVLVQPRKTRPCLTKIVDGT